MPRAGLDAETIVAAAAGVADAEGLEAVTLARLAGDLGVRSPSLYAHVAGGLPELRRRLAARGAAELAVALGAAAAGRAQADALAAVAGAYRAYASEHPGTYAAAQRAADLDQEEARPVVDVVLAVLRGYGLEGDDALHATRIVRAALHGFAALETDQGFGIPLDLDETFARLVAVLDTGLARRESAHAQSRRL
jgi:AcrR family transcriptional regulator